MEGSIGFPLEIIIAFSVMVAVALATDLFLHRQDKAIPLANAAAWSIFYIFLALAFAGLLWWDFGREPAMLFLTGFVLEKALSVDNLFVFMAIFTYFKIGDEYQHRILHWGIIGAIVFRLIFVAIGAGSLAIFGGIVGLIFALIVAWTCYMMAKDAFGRGDGDDDEVDYENQWYIRWFKRYFPVTGETRGHDFFIKGHATPFFLCLIAVEISDILFAFDSVPAVIAVTRDPILVYTCMVFAILGLRSLYFVLTALKRFLVHLEKAVVFVLGWIAIKMALHSGPDAINDIAGWLGMGDTGLEPIKIDPGISLAVVLVLLGGGVVASLFAKPEPEKQS